MLYTHTCCASPFFGSASSVVRARVHVRISAIIHISISISISMINMIKHINVINDVTIIIIINTIITFIIIIISSSSSSTTTTTTSISTYSPCVLRQRERLMRRVPQNEGTIRKSDPGRAWQGRSPQRDKIYGQFSKVQSGKMGPGPGTFELSKGILTRQ